MRELVSRILLGLFSANDHGFIAVAAILMIIEACLSHIVILKVKYTEIDWSTYMQQVECYVNKGIMNYTEIGGDTGPIVYPAGHLFLYRILYFLTSSGRNIRLAQHLFQAFYLFNVFMVFRILQKTLRIPPIVLFLVTVTGYRIHSIFMLRLFNDPLAMLLFYVAMDRFLERKWLVGCVFYSIAVSIKMNVLLFAPALFFTLVLNNTIKNTIGYLAVCGLIQLYVGGIFLFHDWKSYIQRSFDLGRVFMFKWTVNWRFLPEELFLDKRFHIALLVGHLTVLGLFAYYMWFRRLNGLPASLHIRIFEGIHTRTGPLETYYAFCTANLIGIAFSRSLHYQFYSWYFHQLPFLLFCDYPQVDSISKIPWKQFFWKVPLLLAIELCWNVYPSTWWSSALLHICHIIIFWHLISTRPQRPMDFVTKHTKDAIRRNHEKMKDTFEEYSNVVPSRDFAVYNSEEDAVRAFADPKNREKEKEKTKEFLLMELYIELRDHLNVFHNDFQYEFNSETTLKQLKDKVGSEWFIRKENLQLFLEGEMKLIGLGETNLKSLGLKHGGKVTVRHSGLTNWAEIVAYIEEARQAKSVDNIGRIVSSVDSALPHLKLLTASNFFTTYTKFGPILRSFKNEFAHYLDSDDKYIKFAMEEYFSKIFDDNAENPSTVVRCDAKERNGIQGGLIATVSKDGHTLGKYYVKVHIGLAVYPYSQNADLREVFAYKLLELIQIGPKVHFVPNVHYSAVGLYIATEEVIGFLQADEVEMTKDQMSQRELIRRILVLKDLHSANYGVNSLGELSIIDFKVGDNYGKVDKYWEGEDKSERQRVARLCFESWNLEFMIQQANEAIFQQKKLFKKNEIQYKPSRDFDNYLKEIRSNIITISASLRI